MDRLAVWASPPAPDPEWAWFLDIDGTLIELADTPSALHVGGHLPAILERLYRQVNGALALVSGRSLANILQLIAPFRLPLAGCHGAEYLLADGEILSPAPSPRLDIARAILSSFAACHQGLVLEDKGVALALHFRKAPNLEENCRVVAKQVATGDLGCFEGKMVFEVKPLLSNKGHAVEFFMNTAPFQGRTPVFVGDDRTDEDAFAAVRRLGGFGVLVGSPRPTKACYRLENVPATHAWLNALGCE